MGAKALGSINSDVLGAIKRAAGKYTETFEDPLSPMGCGLTISADVPMVTRTVGGRCPVMAAGTYHLLDGSGTLGVYEKESLYATVGEMARDAYERGVLHVDMDADGGAACELLSDDMNPADKERILSSLQPVRAPGESGPGSEIKQSEVLVCLTLDMLHKEGRDDLHAKAWKEFSIPIKEKEPSKLDPRGKVFNQTNVRPRGVPMLTTAASRAIAGYMGEGELESKDLLYRAPQALRVGGSKRKTVNTYMLLTVDALESEDIRLSKQLDAFDLSVHNAATSLYLEDEDGGFTDIQLARIVFGAENPTPKQIEDVGDSMARLRNTTVFIDFREEATLRKLNLSECGLEEFKFDDRAIPAARASIKTSNGKISTGYKMHAVGPIYQHAKLLGQICTIPTRYIKGPGGKTSRDRVIIRDYLFGRIEQARNRKNNMGNRVTYEKIYKVSDTEGNKERQRCRKYVSDLLSDWQELGMFRAWKEYSLDGCKRATGVEITL